MTVQVRVIEAGTINPRWLAERAEQDIIVPPEARLLEPITIIAVLEALDGTSYHDLVDAARAHHEQGTTRIIVDLTAADDVTTAGLIGLYQAAALMDGKPIEHLEGYGALDDLAAMIDRGEHFQTLVLGGVAGYAAQALSSVGFDAIIRVCESLDDAISIFFE